MEAKKIEDIEKSEENSLITVGVFDGVHLGHVKIFEELIRIGEEKGLSPLVLTFYPHPDKVLGKSDTTLIQTLSQRIRKIEEIGIKKVVAVKFDRAFSQISAKDFIGILIKNFKMKALLVGENFRFGKGMEGNLELLKMISSQKKFDVYTVKIFEVNGIRLSSSLIRRKLIEGEVEYVIPLLGRHYSIYGKVVRGYGIGKELGIPTANIYSENEILPEGVFITEIITSGGKYPSVTNIGRAPTIKAKDKSIEVHIIDFYKNVVDEEVEIFLIKKIREEKKFLSIDELKKRIKMDIEIARDFFLSRHNEHKNSL
ncbi:MAG: bifunctional riboflavin kinase/FAD synthetase [Candidatus Aminicenantia bacterium]